MERTARLTATVVDAVAVTPRMRRLTLHGQSLRELQPSLLQDLAIVLTDEHGREARRRYTICRYQGDRLDIEAVLHGDGPGSAWAASAQVGDEVVLYGPRAGAEVHPAPGYLLMADESGLPALIELLPALPSGVPVVVLAEIHDAAERQELPGATDVRWLERDGHPTGTTELFTAALPEQIEDGWAAFVLGESRVISALRDELVRRGMSRDAIHAKGYWNLPRGRLVR